MTRATKEATANGKLLAKALPMLQPRERILIDLFFRQNLSAQDVASILHTSAGAVYTQKSRVLAKLREALEKLDTLLQEIPGSCEIFE